jgi:hypothetical protein
MTSVTHIAVREGLDGEAVGWVEKIGDDQYKG